MKVLVTGASGLLGRAVHARFKQNDHDVHALAFTRSDPQNGLHRLDLTDAEALKSCLDSVKPDVIVHTAAERRPDVVERDPAASNAINVDVPANIAKLAAQMESTPLLINISTDYVFDGTKPPYKVDDQPNPLNAYGVSKLQGERAVLENASPGRYTNLRVPVLYGSAEVNNESAVNVLLDAIKPRASGAGAVKCDAYAVRYPTCVEDVAKAILRIAEVYQGQPEDAKAVPPTTHFSAKEAMTKYDMCLVLSRVANGVGLQTQTDHLDPEYEVDPLAATARPRHCKLDTSVLEDLGIPIDFTPFEEWWRPYLTEKFRKQQEEEARLAAEAEAKRLKEEEEARKKKAEEEAEAARKQKEEEEAAAAAAAAAEAEKKRREEEEQERLRLEAEKERTRKEEEAAAAAAAEAQAEAGSESKDAEAETALAEQGENTAQESKAEDGEAVLSGAPQTSRPASPSQGEHPRSSPTGSPNPSFSSLQARPTPPATSGVPSPSNSVPPSIRSLRRPSSAAEDAGDSTEGEAGLSNAAALGTTPTGSKTAVDGQQQAVSQTERQAEGSSAGVPAAVDSPLNLSAASEVRRRSGAGMLTERSMSGSSAGGQSRLASLTDEKNLFGGTVRSLESHSGATGKEVDADGDNDSDRYGQPSPRADHATAGFHSEQREAPAFQGGPQTVPTGAAGPTLAVGSNVDPSASFHSDASTGAASGSGPRGSMDALSQSQGTLSKQQQQREQGQGQSSQPPQLYHRGSFDAAQLEREQAEHERANRKRWEFKIRVGDPQKVGDPMTAHIVYTVRTTTDCSSFRANQFSALRRYKDFRWLHAALVQNNPGIIVPPVPEKVTIGRFSPELVEARRLGLETCINKIASHPLLQQDDDFRLFLESDNFAMDVKARDAIKGAIITPEQKTRKSWVPGVSAISSGGATHKFHEFDEWFETQKVYLDSLEGCLKQMVKSISAVSAQRKEMAASINEMGNVLRTLSGSSLSRSLSTCFAGLAEVQNKAHEVEEVLAEADVRQLGTVMYEYERTVGSIRKAFATRLDVWQTWQRSCDDLTKAQNRYNKLRHGGGGGSGSVSSHHLQSLLSEVSDAESRSLEKEREFQLVSRRCKSEMERLDEERVEDFRKAVESWLDGMVAKQEELVDEWQGYLRLLGRQMGVNPDALGAGTGGGGGEAAAAPQS